MYTPAKLVPAQKTDLKLSTLPTRGENLLTPEQFQDLAHALIIENLLINSDATLEKSKGLSEHLAQGTTSITNTLRHGGLEYFGQDDKLYVSDGTTNTLIHTFAAAGDVSIVNFGDYIFVTNGSEKPRRVTRTLNYDTQTANFTLNLKVTDQVTGAFGWILEDADAGATGTLTLGRIDESAGAFTNTNNIKDTATVPGSALVNGSLGFTVTEITDAPICSDLFIYDQRLVCFGIDSDLSEVKWSQKFDPTAATPNPPFTNFTTIQSPPLLTDPGSTSFANAAAVNTLFTLGSQLVALYADGESGIRIEAINVDTSGIAQNVLIDFQNEGLGGEKAINVRDGIVFVNEAGVWFVPVRTETNQPFSITSSKISSLFSREFTDELDFTDTDLVYDEVENRVLITCKKNSSNNNFLLIGHLNFLSKTGTVPFVRRTGWHIKRFNKDGATIYGTSSISGKYSNFLTEMMTMEKRLLGN